MNLKTLSLLVLGLALAAPPVFAQQQQEQEDEGMFGPTRIEAQVGEPYSVLLSFEGISVTGGLGITALAGDASDIIDPGLSYTVRALVGSRETIGVELAYFGSAHNLEAIGLDDDAVLFSNAAEAVVRYNFMPDNAFTPYALAGLALEQYTLTNEDFNTSVVRNSDTVLDIPVAGGLAWRADSGFVVDGRFAYRFAIDDELLGTDVGLDSWNLTLKAGIEL